MVDRDRKLSGCCLRQAAAYIDVRLGGQLDLLLTSSTHPSDEPLRRQTGLRGAEPPGAGPDDYLGPPSAELLAGPRDSVRAEQMAPLGHAALVGVKGGSDAAVQRIRRGQLDATDHRKSQQQRISRVHAHADQSSQLVLGQDVQQRRGGDQAGAGKIARMQPGDVGVLGPYRDSSPPSAAGPGGRAAAIPSRSRSWSRSTQC